MSRKLLVTVVVLVAPTAPAVTAGIPEPDTILYGVVALADGAAQQRDPVVIRALLDSGQEIGRYDFADCNADAVLDLCELSCSNAGCVGVTGCGTARDTSPADGLLDDCPGNLYALRVRCESTPDGLSPSGQAAVLNPAAPTLVRILMKVGAEPETHVRNLLIAKRGRVQEVVVGLLNHAAYRQFFDCLAGPIGARPSTSCDPSQFAGADYDDDESTDLQDYAFLQNHFTRG